MPSGSRSSRSRSPARRTSTSRSKSRGSSKSPSRNSKPKSSPAKASKSPTRKSPGRKPGPRAKSPARNVAARKKKPVSSLSDFSDVLDAVLAKPDDSGSEPEADGDGDGGTPNGVEPRSAKNRSSIVLRSTTRSKATDSDAEDSPEDVTDAGDSVHIRLEGKESSSGPTFVHGLVAAATMVLLPALVMGLNFLCNKVSCSVSNLDDPLALIPQDIDDYFSTEAVITVGFFHVLVTFLAWLPFGKLVEGYSVVGSKRLPYRLGGFTSLCLCAMGFGTLWYNEYDVTMVYTHYTQMMSVSVAATIGWSALLYMRAGFADDENLSHKHGNSGIFPLDFMNGREMHPRIHLIDLKFVVWRIGLIGWFLINMVFLAQSYATHNTIDYTLWVAVAMQNMYVIDALFFEETQLVRHDITSRGLGWMSVFTSFVFVPFLNTLTTRYLMENPQEYAPYMLAVLAFYHLLGYFIYRSANNQRCQFKKNPNDPAIAHMDRIPTDQGKTLLISGWWGFVRHPNYLGDLMMTITWSAICGLETPFVYLYPAVMFYVLLDRALNADDVCQKKYGRAWGIYTKRVTHRLIPYVF